MNTRNSSRKPRSSESELLLRSRRESSFLSSSQEARLNEIFSKVRRFVSRKFPSMASTALQVDCRKIYEFRKANPGYIGERSLAHVGCGRLMICTVRWAAGLADGTLAAIILHEFGHVGGGFSEPAANSWVKKNFGIEIQYRGPLDLQWLPPLTVRRILAAHSSSPSS